jgi:hypothetical protein
MHFIPLEKIAVTVRLIPPQQVCRLAVIPRIYRSQLADKPYEQVSDIVSPLGLFVLFPIFPPVAISGTRI